MATAPSGLSIAGTNPTAFANNVSATQTVPGGSQNVNPLGGSVFSTLASTSPVVATLPGQGTAAGVNIGLPTALSGAGQTAPGVAGGYNTGAGVTDPNAVTHEAGAKTMLGDFQATYGQGTGTALANQIAGLGTSTSEALGIMDKATIDAAQQQYGNLLASMGARGVSADSSTAGAAGGIFSTNLTEALSSNAAQLGLQEEQMKLGALQEEGAAHGPDVSGWQEFGNVMGQIGSVAGNIAGEVLGGPAGANLLGNIAPSLFGSSGSHAAAQGGASVMGAMQGAAGPGGSISQIMSDTSALPWMI